MATKVDKVEYERRIRTVQEWVIEEWPYQDMISQIILKWAVTDRQAKRYIKEARDRWVDQEQVLIDHKRRLKIESLRKLKRSIDNKYKGSPAAVRAILAIEKEIITLENLRPATKVQLTGDKGGPIQLTGNITHNINFKKSDGS